MVLRHAGGTTSAQLRGALDQGSVTALNADGSGCSSYLAGILLFIPGFITDFVGACCCCSTSRSRRALAARVRAEATAWSIWRPSNGAASTIRRWRTGARTTSIVRLCVARFCPPNRRGWAPARPCSAADPMLANRRNRGSVHDHDQWRPDRGEPVNWRRSSTCWRNTSRTSRSRTRTRRARCRRRQQPQINIQIKVKPRQLSQTDYRGRAEARRQGRERRQAAVRFDLDLCGRVSHRRTCRRKPERHRA